MTLALVLAIVAATAYVVGSVAWAAWRALAERPRP